MNPQDPPPRSTRRRHRTAFVLLLLVGACTIHQGRPDTPSPPLQQTAYTITRDVIFSPPDWPQPLAADLYRPRGSGPHPAVLLLYGGGWRSGDRTQLAGIGRTLAAHGYVAVAGTYRLAPQSIFPAQLRDVQLAVRWMREHAAEYAIDAQRIRA
ncbi:MAG: alpha/beta hydrolase [Solimonas sp.]